MLSMVQPLTLAHKTPTPRESGGIFIMSHYYATIPRSARRTVPTARGHKSTGIAAEVASYKGAIIVELHHEDGKDCFTVCRIPWLGIGNYEKLAEGTL